MLSLFFMFLMSFSLSCIIYFLTFIQMTWMKQGEKTLPLESGFWCISGGSMKFSIQFFTILLIFVLFDVEIILVSPMVYLKIFSTPLFYSILSFIFLTLFMEWWWGKLTWFDW